MSHCEREREAVPVPEGSEPLSVLDVLRAAANYVIYPDAKRGREAAETRELIIKGLTWAIEEVESHVSQPSAPEPSSDARKVAREIVESYFMYSDRLLDKNALIDRITTALTSTRSQLLKQIREAVEAEQVEDDGSGVWDAGHYDGINDALAAIDRVAKTSQTESTNQSETRAVDGEWQPPIDLTKHFAKHPHVALVDGVLGGVTPIVSKIRISVTHVLGYLYHGKSIPEIGKTYSLSEEAVRDAIAFAHDVYDEVIHGPDDDDDE